MVSCYNHPVAMFTRQPNAHHHYHNHHHPSPTQNHYFAPAYGGSYYTHHPQSVAAAATPTVPSVGVGIPGAQFSPSMTPEFNCSPQTGYHHQFGNMHMSPADTMAAAAATWPQSMYSACAARNIMSNGYEEWATGHGHASAGAAAHPPPPSSFYHHQHQQSSNLSQRSTPSPNSTNNGGGHSPGVYTTSSSSTSFKAEFGPCSGGNPSSGSFKAEFGPCSGGNPQESSQEMTTQGGVSMGRSTGCTPHSPDSGMAVSDGVSSSGSPANGGGQHCLGGGTHHLSSSTTSMTSMNPSMLGSQHSNLNQQGISARPTQARSPFEWMKKPSYSISVSSGGKTRTKDKYRVVYSDNQRLELEKEFHFSRYITIRRKADLAAGLGLSERQVKIWFQNRRAKERKVNRKREDIMNREKMSTLVHMQNAVGNLQLAGGPVMCHGNGNSGPLHPSIM